MCIEFVVQFSNVPAIADVLRELERRTGLTGIIFTHGSVRHPEFSDYWFGMLRDEKFIKVFTIRRVMDYLMEATLATLSSMGGNVDFEFRPEAFEKWTDVRDSYKKFDLLGRY